MKKYLYDKYSFFDRKERTLPAVDTLRLELLITHSEAYKLLRSHFGCIRSGISLDELVTVCKSYLEVGIDNRNFAAVKQDDLTAQNCSVKLILLSSLCCYWLSKQM